MGAEANEDETIKGRIAQRSNLMTRKDFELMASVFKHSVEANRGNAEGLACIKLIVNTFVAVAKGDNPLFNEERFLTACGL